jgi:hypothetical protein
MSEEPPIPEGIGAAPQTGSLCHVLSIGADTGDRLSFVLFVFYVV